MKKFLGFVGGMAIATTAIIPALYQPSQAQTGNVVPGANCVYLREITTGKSMIRKVVASGNSNANVDFAVPTGISFATYTAEFLPENNARFRVSVNFKYNDNTSSTAISRDLNPARRFFLYNVQLRTPTGQQPFQINTNVLGQRNTAYSVAVLACQ